MTKKIAFCFVIVLFLFACQNTPEEVAEEEPTQPEAPALREDLPDVSLIAPLPDYQSEGVSVTLEWDWIRKLNPNEKFDVRVWREGEPELGVTLTSQPYLDLDNWLVHQEPGVYNWRVLVTQREGNNFVRDLTSGGEVRQFTVANVDNPALKLKMDVDGFEAEMVASIPNPTTMEMDEAGNLYVANLTGEIFVRPADSDFSDGFISFASGYNLTTGLLAHEGKMFVSHMGQVSILEDTDGDLMSDTAETLFEDGVLPGRQYDSHSNNGLAIGPDGFLYILVGGTTDHGPEEAEYGGTVLKYDLTAKTFEVFATGVRNPYDLAFDADGNLYANDNGADAPDLNWLTIPPDEINLIEAGKDYGYPDQFGIPDPDSGTEAPVIRFPASSAPTGLMIYSGDQFPDEFKGAIFTALWGNAAINHPTGHRIAVIRRSDSGGYQQEDIADFVRGLRRPIEVIQTIDDTLLVADFETGQIFEIRWTGN